MRLAKYFEQSVALLVFFITPALALGHGMNGPGVARAWGGSIMSRSANLGSSAIPFYSQAPPSIFGSHPLPGQVAAPPPSIFGSHPAASARAFPHAQSTLHKRDGRHQRRQNPSVFIYNFVTAPYVAYDNVCAYDAGCYGFFAYDPAPPVYLYPPAPVYPNEDAYTTSGLPDYAEKTSASGTADFDQQGEEAFRARDYGGALRAWQHAVLDDPNDGTLLMKLALVFFATGQYREAAGATRQALRILPQAEWGQTTQDSELYSSQQDYLDQLERLEKAVSEKPKEPALRFLLGFHYGYSGRVADAVRELDKLVGLAPKDQLGRELRDLIARKSNKNSEPRSAQGQADIADIYVRRDSRGVLYFSNVPTNSEYRPVTTLWSKDYPTPAVSSDHSQTRRSDTQEY